MNRQEVAKLIIEYLDVLPKERASQAIEFLEGKTCGSCHGLLAESLEKFSGYSYQFLRCYNPRCENPTLFSEYRPCWFDQA